MAIWDKERNRADATYPGEATNRRQRQTAKPLATNALAKGIFRNTKEALLPCKRAPFTPRFMPF